MSGELKHTPGPWVRDVSHGADWGYIRDGEGRMVAVCGIPEGEDLLKHRRNGTDPTEANARLIAAAPDLLEALKTMHSLMANGCGELARLSFTWREAFDEAEAAIAKAEPTNTP